MHRVLISLWKYVTQFIHCVYVCVSVDHVNLLVVLAVEVCYSVYSLCVCVSVCVDLVNLLVVLAVEVCYLVYSLCVCLCVCVCRPC